jgi:hypothetical protein
MTNVYRSVAAAHSPAHLPAPHGPHVAGGARAIVVLTLAAVLSAALYVAAAVQAQSALREQTMADARVALAPGLSRADCYAWLRAHHLATNIAFTVWRKTALGVWYRAVDGAWPQPATTRAAALRRASSALVNPDAVVKMSAGTGAACGMTTTERISFDRFDRIVRVTASDPYWSCG